MTMFTHPFMVHALVAGTAVAALCGLVGYFVVQRGQVFAGDALSHVGYTGAMAALAVGIDLRIGLFAACVVAGLVLGVGAKYGAADDVVIGAFFAWVLGLGALLLTFYTAHGSAANGNANANVLFGSIFGINHTEAVTAVVVAAIAAAALLLIARPLLFATLDPAVARAAGVPVRVLGAIFLALVGVTVAEATPVIGALVVLGLLAAPPAAAARLTTRPWAAFWLSAVLATAAVWIGVTLSYLIPKAPAAFTITATAAACYLASAVRSRIATEHT